MYSRTYDLHSSLPAILLHISFVKPSWNCNLELFLWYYYLSGVGCLVVKSLHLMVSLVECRLFLRSPLNKKFLNPWRRPPGRCALSKTREFVVSFFLPFLCYSNLFFIETTPGVFQASGYGDLTATESLWCNCFYVSKFHACFSSKPFSRFWFFASRTNPDSAPLTLWFNGGVSHFFH